MRLGDIFDEGTSEHRVSIDDMMAANGFHKLGDGIDALVYAKDEGKVVKILAPMNDDLRGAKFPIMSMYLFSRQHPNNPYIPKFYPVNGRPWKDFYIGTDRFVEIHMERLQPFTKSSAMGQMIVQMIQFASHGKTWEQFVDKFLDLNSYSTIGKNFRESLPDFFKKVMESPAHKKMFKEIFDTATQLVALGDQRGYEIDIHIENIMLRGNVPVITDPWVADFREIKE